MNIREIIHQVWRNNPPAGVAVTMSMCECGREHRRGMYLCTQCLKGKLVATKLVDAQDVDIYFASIATVRNIEVSLVERIGEDADL